MVMLNTGQLWIPADITTAAWYDAADEGTITESGGLVSQWDDKSGNGRDISQGTGSNQPTTGTRTLNGLNVLDCAGDYLENTSLGLTVSDDISIFIVAEIDTVGSNGTAGLFGLESALRGRFELLSGQPFDFGGRINLTNNDQGWSAANFSGSPHNGPSIYSIEANSGVSEFRGYVDGTEYASTSYTGTGYASFNSMRVFTRMGNPITPNGSCGEFIVVTDVSDATRQKIEGYLAHKWGTVANLDASHPYKNFPPEK